jgi:hypothetical protein
MAGEGEAGDAAAAVSISAGHSPGVIVLS